MKTGVYVGTSSKAVKKVRDGLIDVIAACNDARLDNKTVRCAIEAFGNGVKSPEHMTVSNCHFESGNRTSINLGDEDEE